jgi:hypothetical protein
VPPPKAFRHHHLRPRWVVTFTNQVGQGRVSATRPRQPGGGYFHSVRLWSVLDGLGAFPGILTKSVETPRERHLGVPDYGLAVTSSLAGRGGSSPREPARGITGRRPPPGSLIVRLLRFFGIHFTFVTPFSRQCRSGMGLLWCGGGPGGSGDGFGRVPSAPPVSDGAGLACPAGSRGELRVGAMILPLPRAQTIRHRARACPRRNDRRRRRRAGQDGLSWRGGVTRLLSRCDECA